MLQKADLALDWQVEHPILCIAGRTLLDEATAIMLAQLCNVHGLAARVEGPNALATSNVFRLETSGVALVCLSYLDATNAAHVRYSVRRIRRKLPSAIIMVGCWTLKEDTARLEALLETSKADLVCSSLRDATRLSIETARKNHVSDKTEATLEDIGSNALSNLKQEIS